MVPQWNLCNLKLIFADQLNIQTLIDNIGIQESCTLRCDYYHLMQEVFPEFFPKALWDTKLKHLLERMLMSEHKTMADKYYKEAKAVVAHDGNLAEYLKKIHDNPQYYAYWYLLKIPGNLHKKGSTPAEANHSSLCSHLGLGANWFLPEEIKHLLERDRLKNNQRNEEEIWWNQHTYNTLPSDEHYLAKQCLSKYAYTQLYKKCIDRARMLQSEVMGDGTIKIWKKDTEFSCDQYAVHFPIHERCPCKWRLGLGIQCQHEFITQDFKFVASLWNVKRWYSDQSYDHNDVGTIGTSCESNIDEYQNENFNDTTDTLIDIDDDTFNDDKLISGTATKPSNKSVTYDSVMNTAKTLIS